MKGPMDIESCANEEGASAPSLDGEDAADSRAVGTRSVPSPCIAMASSAAVRCTGDVRPSKGASPDAHLHLYRATLPQRPVSGTGERTELGRFCLPLIAAPELCLLNSADERVPFYTYTVCRAAEILLQRLDGARRRLAVAL